MTNLLHVKILLFFLALFLFNLLFVSFTPGKFFPSGLNGGFSLSNSKSPQVSRTLLSVLADLNSAVTSIVSILSKSLLQDFGGHAFQWHQPQLVSLSLLFSTAFSTIWNNSNISPSFRFLSFLLRSTGTEKSISL